MHRVYATSNEEDARRLVGLLEANGIGVHLAGQNIHALNIPFSRAFKDTLSVWVHSQADVERCVLLMKEHSYISEQSLGPLPVQLGVVQKAILAGAIAALILAAGYWL